MIFLNLILFIISLLSRKTADKYFPDRNAVGNLLTIKQADKEISAVVTAVFEDIPENSTFNADIIGNFKIQFFFEGEDFNKEPWDKISYQPYFTSYIALRKDCDPFIIEEKMNSVLYPPDKNPRNL